MEGYLGDFLKIFTALFALTNPLGVIPIFMSLTAGRWEKQRSAIAMQTGVAIFSILAVSAFVGEDMLSFFGISIFSFRIAGGILVMLMALNMMQAQNEDVRQTDDEASASQLQPAIAVVPLAMPITAGPGAIGATILYAHSQNLGVLIAAIAAISLFCYLALRSAPWFARALGTVGLNVVTRIMGLLLASMAVEFIAGGIKGLFPTVFG